MAPLTAIDIERRPNPRLTRETLVTRSVRGKLELVALLALPPVDPASGPGAHRWWDGFEWTEQTARRAELGVEHGRN